MNSETPIDERRDQRRILRARALLAVVGDGTRFEIRTENASSGGVAVRMPGPLPAHTKVELAFPLFASGKVVNISLTAAVVHAMLSGDSWLTGLAITNISNDHRALLAAYCAGRG